MEIIKTLGCEFRVYRKTKNEKVISISLWKARPGYIFNLSNSLLWWARNGIELFPDWNIRFYMDDSVLLTYIKNDVDWENIIEQLKLHENIELWFFTCPWAKDEKSSKKHKGTFGSIIRFHALIDPEVKITVIKTKIF